MLDSACPVHGLCVHFFGVYALRYVGRALGARDNRCGETPFDRVSRESEASNSLSFAAFVTERAIAGRVPTMGAALSD